MGNIAKIQKKLDDTAETIRNKYGLPNIAGVIVRDNGDTVMHSVQGIRDVTKSKTAASNKMNKEHFFNVGSISKPITGLFIACLIKKGVLSWDTKISDVFQEFKSKPFRDRCGINENFLNTKVYELISHISGIDGNYYYDSNDANGKQRYYGDMDPFRFMAESIKPGGNSRDKEWQNFEAVQYMRYLYTTLSLKKKKFHFNSSKNLGYDNTSGSGYGSAITICAAMAERLLGRAWELIMTELLFDPLSLQVIHGPLPDGVQMHRFNDNSGKYEVEPTWNNEMAPYSSKFVVGGIHCTVAGMAKYIKYNLTAINYSQVFDVAQYQAPVTEATKGGLYHGGSVTNERLNHEGATGSSFAYVEVYNKAGRGFSVMMNSGKNQQENQQIVDELMQELKNIHNDWETI